MTPWFQPLYFGCTSMAASFTGATVLCFWTRRATTPRRKMGLPNISLHAFYVIEYVKEAVEALCPCTVSCADILTLAARDSISLSSGPHWEVPKVWKDGRISKISSGSHTLGFAHCSSFQNRIHNFDATRDVDPSLDPTFGAALRKTCPMHNKVKNAGSTLDPTTTKFDNKYYKMILQGRSIFSSDQALLDKPSTKTLVSKFAKSRKQFGKAFVQLMIKLSSLSGGEEIRLNCRLVR